MDEKSVDKETFYGVKVIRQEITLPFNGEHEHVWEVVRQFGVSYAKSQLICSVCGVTPNNPSVVDRVGETPILPAVYHRTRDLWPLRDDPEAVASRYGDWALRLLALLSVLAFGPMLLQLLVRLWWAVMP